MLIEKINSFHAVNLKINNFMRKTLMKFHNILTKS